ncbi:MAG: hypothetical protein L6R37_001471 [Teloschistes peruensis]|nr:MAG: hypothetical protein L6R37_001471 [Teloschistes peruensis]
MLEFYTQGFKGHAVKYSPFFDSRIAVASAANFGLVGNGRLYILGLTPEGIIAEKWFDTQDALYDISWSESHENQCVVACGDGSVKLFDISLNEFPVQSWQEHNREVFAVHWNLVAKDTFCSSSWDGTIKIVRCLVSLPVYLPSHNTDLQVVSSKIRLPPDPPDPFLHLFRILFTPQPFHPLLRLIGFSATDFRSPLPCLRLESPHYLDLAAGITTGAGNTPFRGPYT